MRPSMPMVVIDSPNFNQRTRVKCATTLVFFTVHIAVITRPIHLLYGGLENGGPLAAVETASRRCPRTGFPTPHCICEPCIAIRFAFLSGSGIVIEVSISTVEPNMAGFDQLETTFELPARNISKK